MKPVPVRLLHLCLITSSSNTLFDDHRIHDILSALHSRRSFSTRQRRRRGAILAPFTPFPSPSRRRVGETATCRAVRRMDNMTRVHRRSCASQDIRSSFDDFEAAFSAAPTAMASPGAALAQPDQGDVEAEQDSADGMPPPSETFETLSRRSTSSATSRNANRLSLTLPIAPPNGASSRPTPSSSMPPTPAETPACASPTDPNDFIIAIAAKERRVLELREELGRAEKELRMLHKQWAVSEGRKKRASTRNGEPLRSMTSLMDSPSGQADQPANKRRSELERRKAILMAQSQGTPRPHRRTVIQGGHTRALSLLSPTKTDSEVSLLDQCSPDSYMSHSAISSIPTLTPINKRATWAPRQYAQPSGVKQIASDFKQGLWTFVEDLRQATVGDEAISGTTHRTGEMGPRAVRTDHNQDTIRASTANRGPMPFRPELDSSPDSPSRSSTGSFSDRYQHRRTASRPEPRARKHFSWTPLTTDNLDDDDWSNWDSPNPKPSRWSGSTVSGEIIPAIPEKSDENEGTLRKRSREALRALSPEASNKLEELPQAILNRLSPSNLKNTTSNFIKEWEKSLSPPDYAMLDPAYQDLRHSVL
ncbi:hypothetical protein GGR56DRAFT_117165 [Xylariaceae sp. FL0804]|nr:hypothetical protein GGR56DRAFT_117165 [Xylariaceae sp. FL0804]